MIYNVLFLLGELTAPVIILIVAALIWKDPPRYGGLGYNTKRSRSSEQAWLFAQIVYGRVATAAFAAFTAVTAAVGLVGILKNFDENTGFAVFIVQNAALVVLLFVVIAIVERKLKAAFDENGKRR